MPRIITPEITADVVIKLNHADAVQLAQALDQVLDAKSTVWVDKTLRQHSAGETCNEFLKVLKKVAG